MQVQTIFIITWCQICKHVGQDKNISIYDLLGGKQCYRDVINDVSYPNFDLVYQHFLFALFVHQRNKQKCYHHSRRIILSENSRNKRIPTIYFPWYRWLWHCLLWRMPPFYHKMANKWKGCFLFWHTVC